MAFKQRIMEQTIDLDSSMNSAQGLLSFMTDASKQIKTYLDEDVKKETNRKQQRRRRQLLHQLNNLNICIPSIELQLEQYNPYDAPTSPVSPACSAYSPYGNISSPEHGMTSSDDDGVVFSSCCYSKNRKRKLTNADESNEKIKKNIKNSTTNQSKVSYIPEFYTTKTTSSDPGNYVIPSPTPDFDDLVDCFLTNDLTPPIDLENYFTGISR